MGRFPLLLLALFTFSLSIFGADSPAAPPPDVTLWLSGLLVWATVTYPWAVTLLLLMGLLRLILKPLFAFLHTAAAGHPAQLALLERVENSPVLKLLSWILDWVASVKVIPITPVQKKLAAGLEALDTTVSKIPLPVLTCAAVVGIVTGCAGFQKTVVTVDPVTHVATTNQVLDVSKLVPAIKVAAKEGTILPLREHPEWRSSYEEALAQLKTIEESPSIDFSLVTALVQKLPLQELKSTEAQIAIEGGTVVLSTVDAYLQASGKSLPLERANDVRAVVTALRQGVEEGLAYK